MIKKLIAIASLVLFSSASLACIRGDLYSNHKAVHFVGTAAVSAGMTYATKNPWIGLGSGLAVGAVREIYKKNHPGYDCEWSSMAYDVAGSIAGTYAGERWLIVPTGSKSIGLFYSKNF